MAKRSRALPAEAPDDLWVLVIEWQTDVPQIAGAWRTEGEALTALSALRTTQVPIVRSRVTTLGRLLDVLAALWE